MPAKYKLTYFDILGLAEPIRFLLSYGGDDFEDVRVNKAKEWPAVKPTTPFGQVPTLEFEGKTIFQSGSICRYLARKYNIAGQDDWEILQADIAVETFGDFRQQVGSYAYDSDEASRKAKKAVLLETTLPYFLPKFDEMVKKNGGYFVGGKLTWADIYWTAVGGYIQVMLDGLDFTKDYPNLKALETKVLAIPNIKAWVAKRPA